MELTEFLKLVVEKEASDGFASVGSAPIFKVNGELLAHGDTTLTADDVSALIQASMPANQFEDYVSTNDANYAIEHPSLGRFRASAYVQREQPALVVRRIHHDIPTFEQLGLPSQLKELSLLKQGLVIVVGATGAGKSSTLASMVDYRNENRRDHIITVEDPIEFVHSHKQSIISQREVGVDTESFEVALKTALRQAPNVVMIGEVRDAETMRMALSYAETGHLCLCTLHAGGAKQALERIQSFFPEEHVRRLWMDLSINLRAIVAQQLLPKRDGSGRVVAVELMLSTLLMQEHIRAGNVEKISELIKRSSEYGMQAFDQAIIALFKQGVISAEQALRAAESENDVRLAIKLDSPVGRTSGRQAFDVEAPTGTHVDKWWQDQ
ncbi:MAG: PilT/PilU family type 4a pilus ATPase [Proteobacteria bacterium]|nr:MAG: PilT/PilU family type 4a pilus ATPase [Pseudomonadota bacterium]